MKRLTTIGLIFTVSILVPGSYDAWAAQQGDSKQEWKALPTFNPDSPKAFQVDLRGRDLSKLDLRTSIGDLMHADFDDTTIWPAPCPGENVGVAPGADLYYVAVWAVDGVHLKAIARGVDHIVEVNRDLPQDDKIRVISIPKGWHPSDEGYEEITEAVQKAQAVGMLVAGVLSNWGAMAKPSLWDPSLIPSN